MFQLVIACLFVFSSFALIQAQSRNFAPGQVKSMFDSQSESDVRSPTIFRDLECPNHVNQDLLPH